MKTVCVVQPVKPFRKRLRPGRQEPAQTESGAVKKAEKLAKWMPGAALTVVAGDGTGDGKASPSSDSGARSRMTAPRACRRLTQVSGRPGR
jgi:hypothetical protein